MVDRIHSSRHQSMKELPAAMGGALRVLRGPGAGSTHARRRSARARRRVRRRGPQGADPPRTQPDRRRSAPRQRDSHPPTQTSVATPLRVIPYNSRTTRRAPTGSYQRRRQRHSAVPIRSFIRKNTNERRPAPFPARASTSTLRRWHGGLSTTAQRSSSPTTCSSNTSTPCSRRGGCTEWASRQ